MADIVTLTMTREQACAVMTATELMARLEIGQFREIPYMMLDRFHDADGSYDEKRRERADNLAVKLAHETFGVDEHGFTDVREKSVRHERCWAVYTTIRHALTWHDHPEGPEKHFWSVAFDRPMEYGEPMPICTVTDAPEEQPCRR